MTASCHAEFTGLELPVPGLFYLKNKRILDRMKKIRLKGGQMNSKEKPEALQWNAEFRFSTAKKAYECEICIGPFPDLRRLVIWRNEYFRALFNFLEQRKGTKFFLCREKEEEFQKTKTLPLAFKEPEEVARNFMVCVSRKLMHLVENQAA